MSRLDIITIAIVAICLAALGYLVYKIVDLMNPPEEPTIAITDDYEDTTATDDSTYVADNWDDEVAAADDDTDLDDDELSYSDSDDEMDTDGSSSVAEGKLDDSDAFSNANAVGSANTSAVANTNSSGKYMVLAGSYQQRANADIQAAKLRRLGYNETQVQIFDRGSYAVVLVERFSSLSAARKLVRDLADDGVEAMVQTKR